MDTKQKSCIYRKYYKENKQLVDEGDTSWAQRAQWMNGKMKISEEFESEMKKRIFFVSLKSFLQTT